MQRVMAIWIPNWPVQRWIASLPEARQTSAPLHLILYRELEASRSSVVVACSSALEARGVRASMPLVEALSLVHARKGTPVSSLQVKRHDPRRDRRALEKLAVWCQRFSPCVGLEEEESPETLLLDVTGVPPLFGGEPALLRQIAHELQQRRLQPRLGLADTVGAAWAIAHAGERVVILPPDAGRERLMALPLTLLRLPADMVDTLQRLGLEQIGALCALPRQELKARLGSLLLKRLDQLFGVTGELIAPVKGALSFRAQKALDAPLADQQAIRLLVEDLLAQLTRKLQVRGAGALQLRCQLNCPPGPQVSLDIGLFRPSADVAHFRELLDLQMERVRLPGPVHDIRVDVLRHAPLEWRQQEFFEPRKRADAPEVGLLINRLASRLGREAIVRCVLRQEAQPELAFRTEPLLDSPARRTTSSAGTSLGSLDRPVHLLSQPLPLEILATLPEGPPIRFQFEGWEHQVARHWGPERIHTGWWRRRGIARDYYRVESQTGHRFWLFRDLRSGQWYLHGVFV